MASDLKDEFMDYAMESKAEGNEMPSSMVPECYSEPGSDCLLDMDADNPAETKDPSWSVLYAEVQGEQSEDPSKDWTPSAQSVLEPDMTLAHLRGLLSPASIHVIEPRDPGMYMLKSEIPFAIGFSKMDIHAEIVTAYTAWPQVCLTKRGNDDISANGIWLWEIMTPDKVNHEQNSCGTLKHDLTVSQCEEYVGS